MFGNSFCFLFLIFFFRNRNKKQFSCIFKIKKHVWLVEIKKNNNNKKEEFFEEKKILKYIVTRTRTLTLAHLFTVMASLDGDEGRGVE